MNKQFCRLFEGTGFLEPMVTYAQNFEDVTLRRALGDIEKGFYVDIGGYHPTSHSVTKYFYDKGWSGINVEPNPKFLSIFLNERKRDINLGLAIGDSRSQIDLHILGDTGLTSTVKEVANSHKKSGYEITDVLTVEMITLEDLLGTYCNQITIDFLKIDVEGAEGIVLNPCNFDRHRPRIILAENSDSYNDLLQTRGYIFCWFDGLNRWYVRKEDEWRCDLIARPVSIWDSVSNINHPW
jgi:FkbM family methyltransferase